LILKQLIGGIIMAMGVLIAFLSGMCSFFIMTGDLTGKREDLLSTLPTVLIFGGIPYVIGIGLFFAGRAILSSVDDQIASEDEEW